MAANQFLLQTVSGREKQFVFLYKKVFPKVSAYVSKMGGNLEEAKDVFQDALIILYENSLCQNKRAPQNEQAYLMAVSKNIWTKRFSASKILEPLDNNAESFIYEDSNYAEISTQKIIGFLESSGQKCMEILKAFYYDNLRVEEIARLFGYSGTHSATVQKYKCMEKVRETVKEKSLSYEEFIG